MGEGGREGGGKGYTCCVAQKTVLLTDRDPERGREGEIGREGGRERGREGGREGGSRYRIY